MIPMTSHSAIAVLLVTCCACTGSSVPPSPTVLSTDEPATTMESFRQPRPGLFTGGRPSEDDLNAAAASGVKAVISLLPDGELGDEAAQVTAREMTFASIPITGAADLTENNARELGALLTTHAHHPVLVHCGSGNRAGALLALSAFYVEGMRASDAISFGLSAGLRSLEPTVREILTAACAGQPDRC